MARSMSGDDGMSDLSRYQDFRTYLITRRDLPGDYRFAISGGKRARAQLRSALRAIGGVFRAVIRVIAAAKIHRLARELELRGVSYQRTPGRGQMPQAGSRPRKGSPQ